MTEPWWRTAVFYQIYPRSFLDSNGDGVGDLAGIVSKLDYLTELGVDALWVSPFFRSPMADFGYDISDYCDVDPVFGTMEDARTLIREAHRRGIRLIFDLVLNHTSDEHPWFAEARSSRDNPKHDWFIWKPRTDPVTGKRLPKPNNWVCQFEFKSAWWDNEATDEWYLGTFTRHQPEVNWRNAELKAAMYDVMRFWLDEGVDGFRLDVVNWYVKDAQFRSNPPSLKANPDIFQKHVYDRNQKETHDICAEMRALAETYEGDRLLAGEIFSQDPAISAAYQGDGTDELHLAFNMEPLYLGWAPKKLARAIRNWHDLVPEAGWPNLALSNHDQPRHGTRFGFRGKGAKRAETQKARMQIAAMILLTSRGTPFIYYGEEIGMENAVIPRKELVDPTGITFWPLPLGRDGERTPMQWNGTPNAGFTGAGTKPWLRLHPDWQSVNVESAMADGCSLWHWYRTLISLRKAEPALSSGSLEFIAEGESGLIAWIRRPVSKAAGGPPTASSIACLMNLSNKAASIALPGKGSVLLGNRRPAGERLDASTVPLAPHEALLVTLEA